MKSLTIMSRCPEISRQTFRYHYENFHAPLAIQYLPFRKYVRNHIIEAPAMPFDVVMEAWFDDDVDVQNVVSPEGRALMDADLRTFMQPDMTRAALVEERILWGAARDAAPLSGRRQTLFLTANFADEQVIKDMTEWASILGPRQRATSISIDIARQPVRGRNVLPYQAILSLWSVPTAVDCFVDCPAGVSVDEWALTDVCETHLGA